MSPWWMHSSMKRRRQRVASGLTRISRTPSWQRCLAYPDSLLVCVLMWGAEIQSPMHSGEPLVPIMPCSSRNRCSFCASTKKPSSRNQRTKWQCVLSCVLLQMGVMTSIFTNVNIAHASKLHGACSIGHHKILNCRFAQARCRCEPSGDKDWGPEEEEKQQEEKQEGRPHQKGGLRIPSEEGAIL